MFFRVKLFSFDTYEALRSSEKIGQVRIRLAHVHICSIYYHTLFLNQIYNELFCEHLMRLPIAVIRKKRQISRLLNWSPL